MIRGCVLVEVEERPELDYPTILNLVPKEDHEILGGQMRAVFLALRRTAYALNSA